MQVLDEEMKKAADRGQTQHHILNSEWMSSSAVPPLDQTQECRLQYMFPDKMFGKCLPFRFLGLLI